MAANQPTDLSDAMLREVLLLLEQGISPGRLRPEAINIARALLGNKPDGNGAFGDIPADLRRRGSSNEPSYTEDVLNEAEHWLAQANLSSHPVGLSLGCFPAGIEAGCRKHLECPTEVEKTCPFRDKSDPASIELEKRWNDKDQDIMPVLRRCQFLGCVRPEKAQAWLETQRKQTGVSERPEEQRNASQSVVDLTKVLGFEGKDAGCSSKEAASHGCLDSLCPHFRRSWKEPVAEASDEPETKNSLNQHRFLQCSISRPWPVYGFDPAKPNSKDHFDVNGLPIAFTNMLPRLDVLPLPRGFTELPVLWLRHAGFSGVGVVVVDETEKEQGVYYLQMGSTLPLLRDYYEMPYFWLGEQPGTAWPEVVQKQLAEGRPQHIQCLFRGHRQAAADPADWKPELIEIFRSRSAERLASFGRGRFLYCPDGEISFFLLCLRLLRLLRVIEGGESNFEKRLRDAFMSIAKAEIWAPRTGTGPDVDLTATFNNLLNLAPENEPSTLRSELINLGLLEGDPQTESGHLREASPTHGSVRTPRLQSLIAWLRHFRDVCAREARTDDFIPTEFVASKPPEATPGWVSLREIASTIDTDDGQQHTASGLPPCVAAVWAQLDDIPPTQGAEGFGLREIVRAILSVFGKNLRNGAELLPSLENMIFHIVRRGRFPLAGYYAWRSSGTRDFCQGHFAIPIGQGNPVTSREDEGSVPWREDQFFLAGIDERLLSGVDSSQLFDPLSGGARRLARGLENVALLGRVLFAPLADSTINYTIFQKRLLETRQLEEYAARSRGHQQTTLMSPYIPLLERNAFLDALTPDARKTSLASLPETMFMVFNENRVYLDVTSGVIGNKVWADGRPDLVLFNIERFLQALAESYAAWAETSQHSDRMTRIKVESCSIEVALPRSYLASILWELITNHQKYGRPGVPIRLTASVSKAEGEGSPDILQISLASPSRDPSVIVTKGARTKDGYGIGLSFIRRTLRFMMGYERSAQISPPLASFGPVGEDWVSTIRIDLARVESRFRAATSA